MEDREIQREYRPELIPRRGEAIAWGSAMLVLAAWYVLSDRGFIVNWALPLVAVALGLAAASISLGNWMDRHTRLVTSEAGVRFQNGLRHVQLTWGEIQEVRVLPVRWGKKVQVFSDHRYFSFNTLGEVRMQGEIKGRMGFLRGEEILRQIVLKSNLQIVDRPGEGYYYARE